ncbi:ATP-binding protein [Kitasatospora sp. NPDC059571]|uniref:ATP-binding protein n=1 Tax=Kitasatospora sp. NPDC059571 TaxID=3346871 RepID=UPI0036B5B2F4
MFLDSVSAPTPIAASAASDALLCGPTVVRRFTFAVPPTRAAVPEARHNIARTLRKWGLLLDGDLQYTLALIVTELVTNAVRHAGRVTPWITVTLQAHVDGLLGVGVADNHPQAPATRDTSGDDLNGRGMSILQILLSELGGEITIRRWAQGGKTIWAHFPLPAELEADAA